MVKKNEEIVAKEILHHMNLEDKFTDVYSKVDGLSLQNLFFCKNGYFPYCEMFSQTREEMDNFLDTPKLLASFKKKYAKDTFYTVVYRTRSLTDNKTETGFSIIVANKNIFARFEKNISESYILYGEGDEKALEQMIKIVKKYYVKPKAKRNNIRMIMTTQAGFDLMDYNVDPVENFDIESEYNDDFIKEADKIKEFIKIDKSGIIILHGEKGTGKSTFINSLISDNPERQFIYFPSALVPLLGDPTFTSFLPRLKNTIMILEDCENALRSRSDFNSSSPVNQLLNLADGLLKSFNIKFICTFNAEIDSIDSALLRKGRLVSKYEFKKLCPEKASALLTKLYGKEIIVKEALSLADIYNYEADSYEDTPKKPIGFTSYE